MPSPLKSAAPFTRPSTPSRSMAWLACVMLLSVLAAPAQAQYRCVDAAGAATYQQLPCPQGQQQRVLPQPSPEPSVVPPFGGGQAIVPRSRWRASTLTHAREGIAMTQSQVLLPLGVRHDDGMDGDRDDPPSERSGDRVRIIRQDERTQPAPESAACPSSREIRAMEIEKNKFQNRDNGRERAELAERLRRAHACQ